MICGYPGRFALAFLILIVPNISGAWKPIAGQSPSPSTTFSLKQSHPGSASSSSELDFNSPTSFTEFGGFKDNHELILPASHVSAGESLAEAISAPVTAPTHPITFTDDVEDHYDSYSLEEDYNKAPPPVLGFTRTPIYGGANRCSVKKFAFNQDGVVEYSKPQLPELDQFTMCFWMRFTNHTGDHVMLTYEAEKEPREIQIWVANAQNSSFLSMAIKGQQMYRLNYPLKMRQWHHMCTSWNGKTGEWQVWLKAERIGRGFHNSLVGHKVPANGKLRSGGPSVTGEVSHGLHFELTLLQVYRVALSAGKAHRDHKHHHVHHFDHEGQEVSTTVRPMPMINRPQPMNALLASGQIPTRVRINLANPPAAMPTADPLQLQSPIVVQQPQQQSITINTNFVNGQINSGSRLVAQQLLGLPAGSPGRLPQPRRPVGLPPASGQFQMLSNSANVQFIDETETRIQFKRQAAPEGKLKKRSIDKKLQKRGLILLNDGSVVDDGAATGSEDEAFSKYNGLADFGGQQFKHDLGLKMSLEEEISTHDREPAEEEVKAVMGLCGGCETEPFQGAIVFAWKDISERMNNSLKGLSVGQCGNF